MEIVLEAAGKRRNTARARDKDGVDAGLRALTAGDGPDYRLPQLTWEQLSVVSL